ncbi:hypothetical protein [Micromonospora sp. NBS 11-29]|uniref:hypothetical protein n=1 Tax=Micromonospora sp. NBS 11-29 TaxID=1960879 RepID=UPI0020CEC4DD|nr:hypothetical protein [Micromonospora sp. NBS 11-29]
MEQPEEETTSVIEAAEEIPESEAAGDDEEAPAPSYLDGAAPRSTVDDDEHPSDDDSHAGDGDGHMEDDQPAAGSAGRGDADDATAPDGDDRTRPGTAG